MSDTLTAPVLPSIDEDGPENIIHIVCGLDPKIAWCGNKIHKIDEGICAGDQDCIVCEGIGQTNQCPVAKLCECRG